jgi:hypothetical protein
LGGLARRATFFKQMQSSGTSTLFLAGTHEVLPNNEYESAPTIVFAKDLIKAYSMLPYHRLYLTSKEEQWLADNGKEPLPSYAQVVSGAVKSEIVNVNGTKVGLVAFPDLGPESTAPTQAVIDEVWKKAKELRPQVKLLLGVSSWGADNERKFLSRAEPLFDIVLGGGVGRGLEGEVSGLGGTLLVRSMTKGKYMNVIDIYAWPDPNSDKKWKLGASVRSEMKELGSEIPDDPAFKGLFKDRALGTEPRRQGPDVSGLPVSNN